MRLRGGDPGEVAEQFALRLAAGLQRLADLRHQSSREGGKLPEDEYQARNMEWNEIKVQIGVLRCLDETLCAVQSNASATDVFTVEQELREQRNRVTRSLLQAEKNMDDLSDDLPHIPEVPPGELPYLPSRTPRTW
eukprot:12934352-Prorocentrum_lima.AAC.1